MYITLTPSRADTPLTLSRKDDALIINDEVFDFGPVPEGAVLPRAAVTCDWLASDVTRIGGVLHLTLVLPHGRDAPQEALFPAPLSITGNGPIALPAYALTPEESPEDVA